MLANTTMGGARKPSGPPSWALCQSGHSTQFKEYLCYNLSLIFVLLSPHTLVVNIFTLRVNHPLCRVTRQDCTITRWKVSSLFNCLSNLSLLVPVLGCVCVVVSSLSSFEHLNVKLPTEAGRLGWVWVKMLLIQADGFTVNITTSSIFIKYRKVSILQSMIGKITLIFVIYV